MSDLILETDRASIVCMDPSHANVMSAKFGVDTKDMLTMINENIAHQKQKGFSLFNVFDKESGDYIGYCGCREIKLQDNREIELSWSIYKQDDTDIEVEVVFAVRNYIFKHFNVNSLVAVISMKEPQTMNIAEAIDMENEYSFFEGFHKFFVYVVNRSSEKFKASYGDGESGATLTSSLRRNENAPSFIRNLRRPRPRPR